VFGRVEVRERGRTHAGVVGLEESDLEAFVGEVTLGLGKVDGSMVRGDLLSRHLEYRSGESKLLTSVHSTLCGREGKQKQSFRWNYPDQVLCLEEAIIV
jgi:hypothetical protein